MIERIEIKGLKEHQEHHSTKNLSNVIGPVECNTISMQFQCNNNNAHDIIDVRIAVNKTT